MEVKRDLQKEKLENILRISKETEYIAQSTCMELRNQDETINRIAEKSIQVSQNIDKSERLVRGMSGFFGRVKNFFSKPKPTENIGNIKDSETVEGKKSNLQGIREKEEIRVNKPGFYQGQEEEDKYLDEICNSVDNIKNMAIGISETLDSQNKKLDVVSDITDRNTTRLNNLNYKAKKLLV